MFERFDRLTDGSRVHIEEVVQVCGLCPWDKWDNVRSRRTPQVIAAEGNDADIIEHIRRLTFHMLIGKPACLYRSQLVSNENADIPQRMPHSRSIFARPASL